MNAFTETRVPAAPVWLKVPRCYNIGRPATDLTPILRRYKSTPASALLRLSVKMLPTRRVDFFENGATRIGIVASDDGEYAVSVQGKRGRVVRLPSRFAEMVPFGVTEISVTQELGMLVIDLSQIAQVPQ